MVKPTGWIGQLIKHMGCSVTENEPTASISADNCTGKGTTECGANNMTLLYKIPRKVYFEGQYFKRPKDAATLRTKVLQSLNFTDISRISGTPARIAIIDRKRTRRIRNLANITNAVRADFPSATLEIAYMEDMQPFEQFIYWSQHDIIITAHGAAVTNAIFLPPGNASALIEIFPLHYYPMIFKNLLRSAGIHHYRYTDGISNYNADYMEFSRTPADRAYYRSVELNPPVDAILALVRQAMLEGGFL